MDYELKKDFVPYTKKILEQYEKYIVQNVNVSDADKHEVTLLINCLFGLLIVPNKLFYDTLDTSKTIADLNKEFSPGITLEVLENKNGEMLSFKEVIISLRNGLAHWFEKECNDNNVQFECEHNEINILTLEGNSKNNNVKIRIRFDVHRPDMISKFLELICGVQ